MGYFWKECTLLISGKEMMALSNIPRSIATRGRAITGDGWTPCNYWYPKIVISPQEGALSRRIRYHGGRLSCNCWSVWKHEGQFLDHQTGLPLLPKRDNAESCQYYPYPDPNIMIIKWTDCPYECNERNNDPFISSFNLCLYSSLLLIFFMCGVRVTYNIETTK